MKIIWALLLTFLLVMEAKAMEQNTEYHFGVRWSVNGMPSSLRIHDVMISFDGAQVTWIQDYLSLSMLEMVRIRSA